MSVLPDLSRTVDVRPLFDGGPLPLLGRTVLVDARFPPRGRESSPVMTGSSCGTVADEVRFRAFAELVEHVSAFIAGVERRSTVLSSYGELLRGGQRAVDPTSLRHFGAEQPLAQIDSVDDHSALTWVAGVSAVSGASVQVPALAAYLCFAPTDGQPIFIRPGATGLAAHTDGGAAAGHGLLEVLERDACMLSWRVPGWPVRGLASHYAGSDLIALSVELGFEVELFDVSEPGLPPVVIAAVHRSAGRELTIGSACRDNVSAAAERALTEALMVRWTVGKRRHQRPVARPRTSVGHVIRAFHRGADVLGWYRHQAQSCAVDESNSASTEPLPLIVGRALDSDVVVVDVTDSSARELGFSVCRVVVPGALPRESDCERAHLGGRRLCRALRACGATENDLHLDPHPFG